MIFYIMCQRCGAKVRRVYSCSQDKNLAMAFRPRDVDRKLTHGWSIGGLKPSKIYKKKEVVANTESVNKRLAMLLMDLLVRICTWLPKTEQDRDWVLKILVIGPACVGKSAFIRSLQSVFSGEVVSCCSEEQVKNKVTEHSLVFRGRALPILLCEYPAMSFEDDDLQQKVEHAIEETFPLTGTSQEPTLCTPSSDRQQAVIFVDDIDSIYRSVDAKRKKYIPMATYLHRKGVPFRVALTNRSVVPGEPPRDLDTQSGEYTTAHCQGMYGVAAHNVVSLSCYTAQQELEPEMDIHILEPICSIIEKLYKKDEVEV